MSTRQHGGDDNGDEDIGDSDSDGNSDADGDGEGDEGRGRGRRGAEVKDGSASVLFV